LLDTFLIVQVHCAGRRSNETLGDTEDHAGTQFLSDVLDCLALYTVSLTKGDDLFAVEIHSCESVPIIQAMYDATRGWRTRRGYVCARTDHGETVPYPDVEPGAVLIRLLYSGICGTDKHTFRGETKQYAGTPHERDITYPLICGHENVVLS
jgi:hypothetical protein